MNHRENAKIRPGGAKLNAFTRSLRLTLLL
jgi:hypothetical protein